MKKLGGVPLRQPQFGLPRTTATTAAAPPTPSTPAGAAPPDLGIVGTNLQLAHQRLAAVTGATNVAAAGSTTGSTSTNSVRSGPAKPI